MSKRHPVARHLCKKMEDDAWREAELAKAANVTKEYVWYLRRFATDFNQIWYLLEAMKKHRRSKCKKPDVWISVFPFVKNEIQKVGPISQTCQEIYENWSTNAD